MALRCAKRNVASITDLADMPWEMAEPILKAVDNPQQLRDIEVNCPHLNPHTGDLWQAIIKRDIPEAQKNEKLMYYPKNPSSWWKIYRKMKREQETRQLAQEEALRQQLLGDKIKKEEKKALFVPGALAHARDEKETNIFVDGVRKKPGTVRRTVSKSVLKDGKSGHSTISNIMQRSAMHNRQIVGSKSFSSASPAMTARQARNQITKAPDSMVREAARTTAQEFAPRELLPHQREMLRDSRRMNAQMKIQAPGRVSNVKYAASHQKKNDAVVRQAREIDEAKLRALTEKQKHSVTPIKSKKQYNFEPSPPAQSPPVAAASPPQATRTPAASPPPAAACSPPKASGSPPSGQHGPASPPSMPVTARKRAAPGSIFAPVKRAKR